MFADYE